MNLFNYRFFLLQSTYSNRTKKITGTFFYRYLKLKYLNKEGNLPETTKKSYPILFFPKFSRRKVKKINVSLEDLHGHFKYYAGADHTI